MDVVNKAFGQAMLMDFLQSSMHIATLFARIILVGILFLKNSQT